MHITQTPIIVSFTKASAKDTQLVTLNLGQFKQYLPNPNYQSVLNELSVGRRLIVEVKANRHVVPLIFIINRVDKLSGFARSATTKTWPDNVYLPEVGNPAELEVVSLELIEETTTLLD
jgi:hypothetical protein